MKIIGVVLGVLALAATACGAHGTDTPTGGGTSDETTADSGTASTPATDAGQTTLAPPAIGFQLASSPITNAPGEEQYVCWSFVLPDTPLSIVATQPVVTPGVHHYAVFTKTGPVPANPSGYDCRVMDATWSLVTGGGVGTQGLTFPTGTAMTLQGGTQVVLQLHILNATSEPQQPSGIVNLVGTDAANLTPVGLLIAGTLDIDLPPHQSGVDVQGGCSAPFDMPNVFAAFPHMHQLGTNIQLSLTAQGSAKPDVLLDRAWDFGAQGVYPVTGTAKKGDKVSITCTYDNTTAGTVTFGESTTDEMCIGVLYYWPEAPGGMGGLGGSNYCGL
jgi:hypothetical protein